MGLPRVCRSSLALGQRQNAIGVDLPFEAGEEFLASPLAGLARIVTGVQGVGADAPTQGHVSRVEAGEVHGMVLRHGLGIRARVWSVTTCRAPQSLLGGPTATRGSSR